MSNLIEAAAEARSAILDFAVIGLFCWTVYVVAKLWAGEV